MFATVLMAIAAFLVMAVVVTVPHEAGHAIAAMLCGVRVEEFAVGFWKIVYSRKIRGTRFSLRAVPLGGFVRLDEASMSGRGPFARLCITVAGPLASVVFGGMVFAAMFMIGVPAMTTTIGGVAEGSPAARAGLQSGDEIVQVNGQNVEFWDDARERINEVGQCAMSVRRGEKRIGVLLVPEKREGADVFGDKIERYVIGVVPTGEMRTRRRGPFEALGAACRDVKENVVLMGRALKKLLTGEVAPSKAMGGPIALASISGKAAEMGLMTFMHFIGIISIMLGMMNLLPLPITDGGQTVVAGVECLRGKPIGPTTERILNYVGIAMMGLLFLYVMYLDIGKLATEQSLIGK